MKKLHQIELFLDNTYSEEERKSFIFKSRCVCNFLERKLLSFSFETKLKRINIKCSRNDIETPIVLPKAAPFLEVWIKYDISSFFELTIEGLQQEYIKIISLGLKVAASYMPIPYSFCMSTLGEFEGNGYVNSWVHSDKRWKKLNYRSLISASLTTEEFVLRQSIFHFDELVDEIEVAKTKPREMLFLGYLGKTKLIENNFIETVVKGRLISSFSIKDRRFVEQSKHSFGGSHA